ncbi:MAG: starch-binding protein [Paludibacteraceae bacterium]
MTKAKIIACAVALLPWLAVGATGVVENRGVYATNPNNQFGQEKTITVDGDPSDWTQAMCIAQGSANDMCNSFKGQHENCVLDCYALYAAWDDANLYLAWQMVNTFDTWWEQDGNGPISDDGYVGDVPLAIAISVDPAKTMTGRLTDGGMLWGVNVVYETPVDHLFMMSGKPGLGSPAMFTAADAQGNTNYGDACKLYSTLGISYKMSHKFLGNSLLHLYQPQSPDDVYNGGSTWLDVLDAAACQGKVRRNHQTKYDSFYEMQIPLSALNITKADLTTTGIGVMMIATRGESGIDCLPHDPSMLDNVYGTYGSDASTSHEKDDSDTIRCQLADIGCRRAGSAPAPAPEAFVSVPDGYTYHADALTIALRLKNATAGSYAVDGGTPVDFADAASVTIGESVPVGSAVTLTVTATNGTDNTSTDYVYTKGAGFELAKGTAIIVKPDTWAEAYCYMYSGSKENAKWPGVAMTHIHDNYYYSTLPSGWSSANVIFNNNLSEDDGKEQYPSGNGLSLKSGEVKLWDWTRWYDVANTAPTALNQVAIEPLQMVVLGNTLYIQSERACDTYLYTIGGQMVARVHLTAGVTAIGGLTTGVYIIEGHKIVVMP